MTAEAPARWLLPEYVWPDPSTDLQRRVQETATKGDANVRSGPPEKLLTLKAACPDASSAGEYALLSQATEKNAMLQPVSPNADALHARSEVMAAGIMSVHNAVASVDSALALIRQTLLPPSAA